MKPPPCPTGGPPKKIRTAAGGKRTQGYSSQTPAPQKTNPPNTPTSNSTNAKKTFRQFVLQTAQEKGHQVETPEEAFGKIIAVQTEIALDPNNGAKATSAAHFIVKTTGILDDSDDQPETERWVLGKKLAGELLQIIEEEKDSRQ